MIFSIHDSIQTDLFSSSTFDELIGELRCKDLVVELSPRLKRGWRVTMKNKQRTLTIPIKLQSSPNEIKRALIEWALLPHFGPSRKRQEIRERKNKLERFIREYMVAAGFSNICSRKNPQNFAKKTEGVKFDLSEIFDSVNIRFFDGKLSSFLRWGSAQSGLSYFSKRTDSSGKEYNLITIAGVYNSAVVPRFVIEGIMYHEMLHIAIPSYMRNGRRVVHGKEYKAAERKLPFYNEWVEWEKKNMPSLLCSARRKKAPKHSNPWAR